MHILFSYNRSSNRLDDLTLPDGHHDVDDASLSTRHLANDNTRGGTLFLTKDHRA